MTRKPQPPRPITTVTRSISFDETLFDFMEHDRETTPARDRSQFIRELLEDRYYGVKARPMSAATKAKVESVLKKSR